MRFKYSKINVKLVDSLFALRLRSRKGEIPPWCLKIADNVSCLSHTSI